MGLTCTNKEEMINMLDYALWFENMNYNKYADLIGFIDLLDKNGQVNINDKYSFKLIVSEKK
ncbi:hypothetical protein [Chengkuizengella axinellae]|uniref:Uncharacterized protein n=1 Tax=Chengkuizengella axinellae TaxID=3064388 RepID=A0ABT9IWG6_9BACL|nr:hypothetical protein [Chengkuizengella sp. 2205SS18-9]MDP5273700.1 hypothetical protein [Chengkuizengella sp. 2205SS18-9]